MLSVAQLIEQVGPGLEASGIAAKLVWVGVAQVFFPERLLEHVVDQAVAFFHGYDGVKG
ncbi:hypothetical protein D3C80_2232540 [compost metagenome]